MKSNIQHVFITLLRAGLWEKEVRLLQFGEVDYEEVMRLAEMQSVVGLVTAGLERVTDVKVPQEVLLQFIGQTLQIEQQNKEMNAFVAKLIENLRKADIYAVLVKGQGIAQCYENPLWRTNGDVDLLLSDDNYHKAKSDLCKIAEYVGDEKEQTNHLDMSIEEWTVELHGSLHCRLSKKVDRVIDNVHYDVFYKGNVRSWMNGKTSVFLPSHDNDAIFVFTHILQHLFKGGIGLRQICDWCRLLWTYRSELDAKLLEQRLKKAGLISEWKTFAAFAVNWLGMPEGAMPFYSNDSKWKKKSDMICSFIMEVGNFGHNRELSYTMEQSAFLRKYNITKAQLKDSIRLTRIFPMDAPKFFFNFFWNGLKNAVKQM